MRRSLILFMAILLGLVAGCSRDADPVPGAWTALPYGAPQLSGFSEVRFASAQVGWVSGGYASDATNIYTPTLLSTRDGGASWTQLSLRPLALNGFQSLAPVNEQLVFALGVAPVAGAVGAPHTPNNARVVLKSTDGGTTWQQLAGLGFLDSFHLHFFSAQLGLSFYGNQMQRTTDGGASWASIAAPTAGSWDWLQFPTASVGYAAGGGLSSGFAGGYISHGSLMKTTDQGATWQALPWTNQYIQSLSFVSATVGFVATFPDYHLYKTQDGGRTWQLANARIPAASNGHFLSEQEGYFAENSTIQHTRDGGLTWRAEYQAGPISQYPATINSLTFPTPAVGFAVTSDGQVIKGTH